MSVQNIQSARENEYLRTLVNPFGPATAGIPDTRPEFRVMKSETYSENISGYTSYLHLFTPHSRVTRSVIFVKKAYQTDPISNIFAPGTSWVPLKVLKADDQIQDNYSYDRVVSAATECYSNTVSSGNFDLQGQIYGVAFQQLFDFRDKTGVSITPFKKDDVSAIVGNSIMDGIVGVADPLTQDFLPTNTKAIRSDGPSYQIAFDNKSTTINSAGAGTTTLNTNFPAVTAIGNSSFSINLLVGTHIPWGLIGKTDLVVSIDNSGNYGSSAYTGSITAEFYRPNFDGSNVANSYTKTFSNPLQGATTPRVCWDAEFNDDSPFPLYGVRLVFVGPTDLGPYNSATTYIRINLRNQDSLSMGYNQPGIISLVENVGTSQVIVFNSKINYEAIPNAELAKNLKTRGTTIDNLDDLDHARFIMAIKPEVGLRSVYSRNDFLMKVTTPMFRQLSYRAGYSYRAGFFGDLWKGIKNIGAAVAPVVTPILKSKALEYITPMLAGGATFGDNYTSGVFGPSYEAANMFNNNLIPGNLNWRSGACEYRAADAADERIDPVMFEKFLALTRKEMGDKNFAKLIEKEATQSFFKESRIMAPSAVVSKKTLGTALPSYTKLLEDNSYYEGALRGPVNNFFKGKNWDGWAIYTIPIIGVNKASYMTIMIANRAFTDAHGTQYKNMKLSNTLFHIDAQLKDADFLPTLVPYAETKAGARAPAEIFVTVLKIPADYANREQDFQVAESSWSGSVFCYINKVPLMSMVSGVWSSGNNMFVVPDGILSMNRTADIAGTVDMNGLKIAAAKNSGLMLLVICDESKVYQKLGGANSIEGIRQMATRNNVLFSECDIFTTGLAANALFYRKLSEIGSSRESGMPELTQEDRLGVTDDDRNNAQAILQQANAMLEANIRTKEWYTGIENAIYTIAANKRLQANMVEGLAKKHLGDNISDQLRKLSKSLDVAQRDAERTYGDASKSKRANTSTKQQQKIDKLAKVVKVNKKETSSSMSTQNLLDDM